MIHTSRGIERYSYEAYLVYQVYCIIMIVSIIIITMSRGAMVHELVAAAATGDTHTVNALIGNGVDVSSRCEDQDSTAIEAAALEGHSAVVEQLLAAGAEVNSADANAWTALHNAVAAGHLSLARTLLVCPAVDVQAQTAAGLTALHLVSEADPKVDFKVFQGGVDGRSAFFAPALVQTLCNACANVNAAAHDGSTPLHQAAATAACSTIIALLSNQADMTAADHAGRLPWELVGTRANGAAAETLDRLRSMLTVHALDEPVVTNSDEDEVNASWAAALEAVRMRLQQIQRENVGATDSPAQESFRPSKRQRG